MTNNLELRNNKMIEKKYLYWASLAICAVLYFVWPTIHTIALRKVLLLSGAALAVYIWIKSSERKIILSSPWLIYSGLLFAWVILHATFISQNGAEAWREFLGQWVPPYLGMIAGIGCAFASRKISPRTFKFYLLAMLSAQAIFYVFYTLIKSVQTGQLAMGYTNWGITDHKMSLTFYADLLAAVACAKIIEAVKSGRPVSKIYPWLLLIALALYVAFFADSLNGFILVGGCLMLTAIVIVYMLRKKIPVGAFVAASLLAVLALYMLGKSSYMDAKWKNLASNTRIAVNIDTYANWTNFEKIDMPINEQGVRVSESYYLRVAYATAGVRTIMEHPLGYGVTRHAFERLIQQKYPDAYIANSHNAYIDLVSAVGFPALLLLALMVIAVFRQLNSSSSEWAKPAMWMTGVIMAHWMLDPISRDHYFETFMFLIGLFATLTLATKSDHA